MNLPEQQQDSRRKIYPPSIFQQDIVGDDNRDIFQPEHDVIERYRNKMMSTLSDMCRELGIPKDHQINDEVLNNLNKANQLAQITSAYREFGEEPEDEVRSDVREELAHLLLGLSHKNRLDAPQGFIRQVGSY